MESIFTVIYKEVPVCKSLRTPSLKVLHPAFLYKTAVRFDTTYSVILYYLVGYIS